MRERPDALEDVYGRLSATRLTLPAGSGSVGLGPRPAGAATPRTPRSLLLPRLALLGPRAHVRSRGTDD